MARNKLQKQILKDTISKMSADSSNIIFSEIPTGTGKTKILLDVAFERLAKSDKSIIISTSNNFLALEFLKEAKKFGYDKNKIGILIGKDNYINTEIIDDLFLQEYNLNKKEVDDWIEEHKNLLLINLFMEHFNLPDEAEMILGSTKDEEDTIANISSKVANNKMIYITNHYYLIFLLMLAKNEKFFDIDIYVDEVHLLNSVAKNIYKKSFSPYRLSFFLRQLLNENKTNKKYFIALAMLCKNLIDSSKVYAKKSSEDLSYIFKDKLTTLVSNDLFSKIKDIVAKKYKKSKKELYRKTLNEMYEALAIANSNNTLSVTFSAVKQYVTFNILDDNPINRLKSVVSKHTGNFWGVSGTLRIDTSDTIAENKWTFERLGFFEYKNPNCKKDFVFNYRVKNISLKVYPSIFKRSQAVFHIANEDKYLPPKDYTDSNSYLSWIKNIATLAKKVFFDSNRSGLILMSSYENSELMQEALMDNGLDEKYKIITYKLGNNMRKIVKEHKEIVDSGNKAILIGGLQFYTGIDLGGDYLKILFIGKLPLESKRDYFTKIKYGSYSAQAELRKNALLTFRQGIGRAIRSENDRAFIVVADPRINNSRYKAFKKFLEEMAVETK